MDIRLVIKVYACQSYIKCPVELFSMSIKFPILDFQLHIKLIELL